jgi:light-regulated signal transduction histidine kinase (bacteriophytochrome)
MIDQTGAQQQRREASEDMQGFLDRMVHDLREPLRSINIFAEMLKKGQAESPDPKSERAVDEILKGAARMRTLLEGISSYTAARYQEDAGESASLDLAARAAIDRLGAEIRACGGKVTAERLPRVGARLEPLIQLFDNLIGNALKFHGEEPPSVQISARQEASGEWTVRVQDDGMGIDLPPAELDSIFAPFARLNGHKYPGAGLGLAVSRLIVEQYGGRIWAEPVSNGSAFLFTLPPAEE